MQHEQCKALYRYWESVLPSQGLPDASLFTNEMLDGYSSGALRLTRSDDQILVNYMGKSNLAALSHSLVDLPLTDMYPHALQAMHTGLITPCFNHAVGMVRMSRVWFGHRHKDLEVMLLPVADPATDEVILIGLSVTFKPFDERDYVSVGSPMCERVIWQKYLADGKPLTLSELTNHSWAVLDMMGTQIIIDEVSVGLDHVHVAITGAEGEFAASMAKPNVLAVARILDFSHILKRIGARYTLKLVESLDEARAILREDRIDVLMVTEGAAGSEAPQFMEEAQHLSRYTACVLMLDPGHAACDLTQTENGKFIQHLVRPVGEFALRRAIDDASAYVVHRRHDQLNKHSDG